MAKPAISNYAGREQAFVKHYLLDCYLPQLVYKVGRIWDSIVYIDGFAGPWQVNDPNFADSSFGIAIDILRKGQAGLRSQQRNVQMTAILVEHDRNAFSRLNAFAASEKAPNFHVHALQGDFVDKISDIEGLTPRGGRTFRFVLLDPKGWSDFPMAELQPFLKDRSCEVLINLMTSHIIRFVEEDNRAASYRKLFGRDGVLEKLRSISNKDNEKAEQAVIEYCESLQTLCGFKYVSSAAILAPDRESVKYYLVYGTNDVRGIEVFKQAEIAASKIQDEVRHATRVRKTKQEELFFDEGPPKSRAVEALRERYLKRARERILLHLRKKTPGVRIDYDQIFCEAMAFPLTTPDDLLSWLESWKPHVELQLTGSTRRKKPSPKNKDSVVVITHDGLK